MGAGALRGLELLDAVMNNAPGTIPGALFITQNRGVVGFDKGVRPPMMKSAGMTVAVGSAGLSGDKIENTFNHCRFTGDSDKIGNTPVTKLNDAHR